MWPVAPTCGNRSTAAPGVPAASSIEINVPKLAESRLSSDQAEFLFDVEFHPEEAQVFHKTSRIIVRLQEGSRWKVTQFTDYDPL